MKSIVVYCQQFYVCTNVSNINCIDAMKYSRHPATLLSFKAWANLDWLFATQLFFKSIYDDAFYLCRATQKKITAKHKNSSYHRRIPYFSGIYKIYWNLFNRASELNEKHFFISTITFRWKKKLHTRTRTKRCSQCYEAFNEKNSFIFLSRAFDEIVFECDVTTQYEFQFNLNYRR